MVKSADIKTVALVVVGVIVAGFAMGSIGALDAARDGYDK